MKSSRVRLYDLADELYRLAPWTWMGETQLVGLIHPETGELARVSIMGASGNHLTLALYLGDESLHRFNLIQDAAGEGIQLAQEDVVALILEARQLQTSFATRDELLPQELGEIKALGRKYRGENWPCFRTFRPGWAPSPVDGDGDVAWLEAAMEQILAVAPALRGDRFGDYRAREGGGIEHIARERGPDGAWRTTWVPCDSALYEMPRPEPGEFFVAKVAALPASNSKVECQFQLVPSPIGERGKPATFPYVVASAESKSGFVLGAELLSVEAQSHENLIASVPDHFLQQWASLGQRPAAICVATETTRALLEKTAAALRIPIQRKDHLPALSQFLAPMVRSTFGYG